MCSPGSRGFSTRCSRRITSALSAEWAVALSIGDLIEGQLVLAAADQFALGDHDMTEPAIGQRLQRMRVAPGVERVRHQHCASSVLRSVMPCCASITALNLMLKPILRIPADLQQRLQRGQRIARLDLVRREACVEQARAVAGLAVRERHVAGVIRRQRQRDAADIGLHRIAGVRLGVDREATGVPGARDPGVEFCGVADGLVLRAIDRQFFRGFLACRSKRDRRSLGARGLVLFVRTRPGGGSVSKQVVAAGVSGRLCTGRRGRGGICRTLVARIGLHVGRIYLRIFGDAAGEGGEFHRLEESDQLAGIRLVHREVVERHLEIDLVVEQYELSGNPGLLGVLEQGLAPLRLLDLAGAEQQVFEVAILDDQLRGGLDADAGHAGHVVEESPPAPAPRRPSPAARRISRSLPECRSGGPSWCRTWRPCGPTSCIRSLSDETMVVRAPRSPASRA